MEPLNAKFGGRPIQGNAFTTNGFHPRKWYNMNLTDNNYQLKDYFEHTKRSPSTLKEGEPIDAINPQIDMLAGLKKPLKPSQELNFPFFVFDPLALQPESCSTSEDPSLTR